ncbi:ester cyclase [Saccharopolyspora sp. MS10]|uniref:ester cyclase n=1 Tax=Saccharopolyspora sp. MS10 TaxID=3385973 RepID=UPI0039A2E9DA
MTEAESRREHRVRRAWAASWDRGEVDALDDLLAPGYRRHSTGARPQGREEFQRSILATREAFPDLSTSIDEVVEAGDRMAIRWHSTGTHTGTFLDVPATGRRVEVTGVVFAHFDGERVVDEWVTWDPRQLLTALGIISLGEGLA